MREIKFRAWDRMRNRMLYPTEISFNYDGKIDVWYGIDIDEKIRTTQEFIMQYTELKDKNGKEIYCGDIVQYGLRRSVIEFIENGYKAVSRIQRRNQGKRDWFKQEGIKDDIWSDCEIIGNIYENPELLEKG